LIRKVWPDAYVEEGNLSFNISVLRKALSEGGGGREYIETIPKRGYRFVAPVSVSEPVENIEALTETARPADAQGGDRAIAVLPFKLLVREGEDEYLGLGMADALITRLSNLREFIVRPTSAVRKYADGAQDALAAGRELRVDAVLEGSIRRLGERLRVTVQLVNVKEQRPLWAEKYDEKLTDIFTVEDRVSEKVAEALRLNLTVEGRRRLFKRYTENAEAQQLYLKGRFYWNKRTAEGMRKGVEQFRRAIELDPSFALAHAGLAECHSLLGFFGAMPPAEAVPPAQAIAVKALELDETLAEAHAALAYMKLHYYWDWKGAEAAIRRAIELDPHYATAYQRYSYYLMAMGRHAEAIAAMQRAHQFDPVSLIITADLCVPFYFARRYDEMLERVRQALEMDPYFPQTHFYYGQALERLGKYDESVAAFQKSLELSDINPWVGGFLGYTLAVSGRVAEARRLFNHLRQLSQTRYVSPYALALISTGSGEYEDAFRWLEIAYQERAELLFFLKVEPKFDCLRPDPRFSALLERLNLYLY
jgi:TolB-like protein/Flp pilus assembly protein TadD